MGKYLFDNLKMLNEFKNCENTAIITDIDGTISKISPTPQEAVVNPDMKQALIELKEKFNLVAVISGRSVCNAQKMVGVNGILYVGNHGLEYLFDGKYSMIPDVKEYLSQIKQFSEQLDEELSNINGLLIEDKGICCSIHYRQCKNPEIIRERIIDLLKKNQLSKDLQISEGRKLIELKPPTNYNKGTITRKIIEDYGLERVIYMGDDITDFDAFKEINDLNKEGLISGVSVLVISDEIPTYIKNAASFFVHDINEVLKFFKWLLN